MDMNNLITPELLYGAAALAAAALGLAAGFIAQRKRPVPVKAPVVRQTGRYQRVRRQG